MASLCGNTKGKLLEKVVLMKGWSLIRVFFHQWSLRMVFHHSGLIRVVFHHSGLLSGRSCISGPTGDEELCELFIIFYWMLSDAKNNPKYMSLNPVNG